MRSYRIKGNDKVDCKVFLNKKDTVISFIKQQNKPIKFKPHVECEYSHGYSHSDIEIINVSNGHKQ